MKTVSVREMKANWAEIERQVAAGETFEVQNRGKPTVMIVPAKPREVLVWDDFDAMAVESSGKSGSDLIIEQRRERW